MTTPGRPDEPFTHPYQPHQPPGYGYPQQPGGLSQYNPGYPPQPAGYAGYPHQQIDPSAPYGRDPATGQPLSDKSAVAAGLLQLFLGWFGAGRFYIGSTTVAVVQLAGFLVSVFLSIFLIGFVLWTFLGIWVFIDAIMMFTGSVKDGQGRKLRSG